MLENFPHEYIMDLIFIQKLQFFTCTVFARASYKHHQHYIIYNTGCSLIFLSCVHPFLRHNGHIFSLLFPYKLFSLYGYFYYNWYYYHNRYFNIIIDIYYLSLYVYVPLLQSYIVCGVISYVSVQTTSTKFHYVGILSPFHRHDSWLNILASYAYCTLPYSTNTRIFHFLV